MLLRQAVDRVGECLLTWFHVPPDVAVAFVSACFLSVVDALLLSELSEEGVSQHVWGDVDRLAILPVGVGLVGDTLENLEELVARERPAATRGEDRSGIRAAGGEPLFEYVPGFLLHWDGVADATAFHEDVPETAAGVLFSLQRQQLRDSQS